MTTDEQVKAIRNLDRLFLRWQRSGAHADRMAYAAAKVKLERAMVFVPDLQTKRSEAA